MQTNFAGPTLLPVKGLRWLLLGSLAGWLWAEDVAVPPPGTEADLDLAALRPPEGWEKTSARAWAEKLRLPLESETPYQASYRSYPGPGIRILGANPKSIALLADQDRPEQLTILLANKGDSAGERLRNDPGASASLRDVVEIKRLIQADDQAVGARLAEQLGKPSHQGFGDGGKAREFPRRWDSEGTSFLLTHRPGEYCVLRVVPTELADHGGPSQRLSDVAIRERMKNSVVRRPNGDVLVANLPMIDQGPKGFCVPATYTRVLLYSGVPADLYVLALLGKTGPGGGTSIASMENSVRSLAAAYGRSISSVSPSLDLPKLQSYFEKGIPLIWAMYIDPELDRDLTARMQSRPTAEAAAWRESLEPKRKAARHLRKNPDNAHVCLLVGCNRATQELATSDSWGPEFAERWITLEEARALSQGDLGAIVP